MAAEHSPLARALGRLPSGLYIVTTKGPDGPLGFLGSFVQQFGFEPPTVAVAIGKDRDHLAATRESGTFALNVLDPGSKHLMPPFFGKFDGDGPFDGLNARDGQLGAPLLTDALAWLDCKVCGEHEVGDHVVVFGEVLGGELAREGDPNVHLRKNGLSY